MDQTGCLLTHDYSTSETTLKWDTELFDPDRYGTADDVQTAIEGITGGRLDHRALFAAFQVQMTASKPLAAGSLGNYDSESSTP
ncbi:hypothetical protein AOC05_17900 [Arthrobacter alpinus]|uniref:Uncharacterized protein n=1 Tax=Arthrobacter alpinus TaxID=656366 RepID=A0A0M4QIK0_9MICC|nr:hypothetical protein [Arthrobacter alpinus]ALE93767.1 hypothetical protein AOC05_17900 [Arthrobacter alpinus]